MPLLSRYQVGKPWSAMGPTCTRLPSRGVGGVTTAALAATASGAMTAAVAVRATASRLRCFLIWSSLLLRLVNSFLMKLVVGLCRRRSGWGRSALDRQHEVGTRVIVVGLPNPGRRHRYVEVQRPRHLGSEWQGPAR